jgi:hypothetical protein
MNIIWKEELREAMKFLRGGKAAEELRGLPLLKSKNITSKK